MTGALLAGAVRTPHGRYGGALRGVPVVALGTLVARAALERAGVPADAVQEVIVANCRQAGNGPNPGRQVGVRAGVPESVPAQTINMACASGLKILHLASQSIAEGADVVLAVAMENMSRMPFLTTADIRWGGVRHGNVELIDGWRDGGTDPLCDLNMGQTAELIAERYGIGRDQQDAWALRSHARVAEAWRTGAFAEQVVPVALEGASLEVAETFRTDSSLEKLARLRPAFAEGGTVTAGNASQMSDGAAAIVVLSKAAAARLDVQPQGRVRAFAAVGVDPAVMGIGPTRAIPRALAAAGMEAGDVDLWEINEAFAAQIVQNVRELGLDEDRVNVNGGGIALGHPTGQSGCRITVSLLHELARRGAGRGVASLCVGGGQGVAMVVERP
jgi:acetyl-CoA C-acetyltransferase